MSEWMKYGVRRRDASEPAIVAAFREGGATVLQLTGRDIPDLAVGYLGHWHLVEVKTNTAKLRPGQKHLLDSCRGEPPSVVRTAPQAKKLLRLWSDKATSLSSLLRAANSLADTESQSGGGVDAAIEEHVDGLPETCAGKDPTQPY